MGITQFLLPACRLQGINLYTYLVESSGASAGISPVRSSRSRSVCERSGSHTILWTAMPSAMPNDIDHLSYEVLAVLNHRIVEPLKFPETPKAHQAMVTFDVGARVSFETGRDGRLTRPPARFTYKTVTLLTEDGRQWRVPPEALWPIKDVAPGSAIVPHDDNRSE